MKKRITSLHTRLTPPFNCYVQAPAPEFWITFRFNPRDLAASDIVYDTNADAARDNMLNTSHLCFPFKRQDNGIRFHWCGTTAPVDNMFTCAIYGFRFIFTNPDVYNVFVDHTAEAVDLVHRDFNKLSRFGV